MCAEQACKMLGDTKVPQFYPSMFILISRVLDKFGELVFLRIKDKHAEVRVCSLSNVWLGVDVTWLFVLVMDACMDGWMDACMDGQATKGMTKPLKEDFDCDDLNIEAKEVSE